MSFRDNVHGEGGRQCGARTSFCEGVEIDPTLSWRQCIVESVTPFYIFSLLKSLHILSPQIYFVCPKDMFGMALLHSGVALL
jgi:hypothetical protein